MSKPASHRRFQKLPAVLAEPLSGDTPRLLHIWHALRRGWSGETPTRAWAWRLGRQSNTRRSVFEVLEQARRLACAAGAEDHRLVVKNLTDLQHLRSQVMPHSFESRQYRFHDDCATRAPHCIGGWA